MTYRKQKIFSILAAVFCLGMSGSLPTQAAEVEVLRGEEAEIEVYLEGSEEIYSFFGTLEADTDYVLLQSLTEKNTMFYQSEQVAEDGSKVLLLLSSRGDGGNGLSLRLKVEGKRIGESVLSFTEGVYTDGAGQWLTGTSLSDIAVKVLPNPLNVLLSGTIGNGGWYTGAVKVTVEDKDAAEIWYTTGSGSNLYTAPFSLGDGEWVLTVTSDDGFGYKKEENINVFIDTVKPSLTISETTWDWQPEVISLTANALDEGSGIGSAGWAFSDEKNVCGSYSCFNEDMVVTMEEDGVWYLHLTAADVAGNIKNTVYGPYRKDSVAPEVSITNIYEGEVVEKRVVPEISASDDRSGIQSVSWVLDGEEWELGEVTGRGDHVLSVTVEDMAGNTATDTVSFTIYDPVEITVKAEDTHYTGEGLFYAEITYEGEALSGREAEFFLNGESIGTKTTDRKGRVWLQIPVEIAPQIAVLTVKTAEEDGNYLMAGEGSCEFIIHPEQAWLHTEVSPAVLYGEALTVDIMTGEMPDHRMGDLTKAEIYLSLYLIEEDGSRSLVEEAILHPEEDGLLFHEFYPETGLYELEVSFGEDSYYTGLKNVLYTAVYDIQASIDFTGGSLLLDLPQFGIYVRADITFSPEFALDVVTEVRIPGTGITLTENRLTDYDVTTEGLVLRGSAKNPKDGDAYCYEVRIDYSIGGWIEEAEVTLWKGTDTAGEPVYHYLWPEDIVE